MNTEANTKTAQEITLPELRIQMSWDKETIGFIVDGDEISDEIYLKMIEKINEADLLEAVEEAASEICADMLIETYEEVIDEPMYVHS